MDSPGTPSPFEAGDILLSLNGTSFYDLDGYGFNIVLQLLLVLCAEYDIASLYMASVYCFVTKACARRPGAAASVERRRRERRSLLAGAAGELAGATRLRQAS